VYFQDVNILLNINRLAINQNGHAIVTLLITDKLTLLGKIARGEYSEAKPHLKTQMFIVIGNWGLRKVQTYLVKAEPISITTEFLSEPIPS